MHYLKYQTKHFYNNIFEKGTISIINCPTQISGHSESLIDSFLMTEIFTNSLKNGIVKSDASDHFLIFYLSTTNTRKISGRCYKNKGKGF